MRVVRGCRKVNRGHAGAAVVFPEALVNIWRTSLQSCLLRIVRHSQKNNPPRDLPGIPGTG